MVVCIAHRLHHLALHVLLARHALGAVQLLVVGRAIVGAILGEVATRGQRFVARGALEARLVEVFVVDAQHLAGALFRALGAVDFGFACGRNGRMFGN